MKYLSLPQEKIISSRNYLTVYTFVKYVVYVKYKRHMNYP